MLSLSLSLSLCPFDGVSAPVVMSVSTLTNLQKGNKQKEITNSVIESTRFVFQQNQRQTYERKKKSKTFFSSWFFLVFNFNFNLNRKGKIKIRKGLRTITVSAWGWFWIGGLVGLFGFNSVLFSFNNCFPWYNSKISDHILSLSLSLFFSFFFFKGGIGKRRPVKVGKNRWKGAPRRQMERYSLPPLFGRNQYRALIEHVRKSDTIHAHYQSLTFEKNRTRVVEEVGVHSSRNRCQEVVDGVVQGVVGRVRGSIKNLNTVSIQISTNQRQHEFMVFKIERLFKKVFNNCR